MKQLRYFTDVYWTEWAYDSRLGARHLVRYLKPHILRVFVEELLIIKYQTMDIEFLVIWLAVYSRYKSDILYLSKYGKWKFYHRKFPFKLVENVSR